MVQDEVVDDMIVVMGMCIQGMFLVLFVLVISVGQVDI